MARLAHAVFFTLHDQSDEAIDRLIAACKQYLDGHPGTLFFSAGRRARDLTRDVNDTVFDASLHVVFADRAAHDAYQAAPRHLEFVESQRANWAEVRVFDSELG